MTTASTMPRPAPREAPTAAAVKEDALALEFRLASIASACSRASSAKSRSLANSLNQNQQGIQNLSKACQGDRYKYHKRVGSAAGTWFPA